MLVNPRQVRISIPLD